MTKCLNGHQYNSEIYGDECPFCARFLVSTSVAMSSKKYHFRDYYKRFRVCKKCGEYVSNADVCPACGNAEINIIIADKYAFSNPKRCKKCSYESWGSLSCCPKCGGEMDLMHTYIVGDFASLGEYRPYVEACSEDEDVLKLQETRICFNALPGKPHRVNVACNYYDWYVQNTTEWIKVSISWEKDYLEITVLPNPEKEVRTAFFEIICGTKKETVTVCQYGLSIYRISSIKELLAYLKRLSIRLINLCGCCSFVVPLPPQ